MPFFDLPLGQLQTYAPIIPEPSDFDVFWEKTLQDAREYDINARFIPYDTGLRLVDVWDVTFAGYGGQDVRGWYLRPTGISQRLPLIVEYMGYGGGRGFPHDWLFWANAGYAHFIMDTRGQGSYGLQGDTPDISDGDNPHVQGFMTQGIRTPQTYYYRRVFTDAIRAIDAMQTRDDINAKIAVTGASQGGGITLAAAALHADVQLVMPEVPFLCYFRRSVGLTDRAPYTEIVQYLSIHRDKHDETFATLDYFDGVNMAKRIKAPSFFSVGLMDPVCAPSTVYAAYNAINAPKAIAVYPFNEHEGGGSVHMLAKLNYANQLWR